MLGVGFWGLGPFKRHVWGLAPCLGISVYCPGLYRFRVAAQSASVEGSPLRGMGLSGSQGLGFRVGC